MPLSTSKTVLKILGILTIIGAAITLIFGILTLIGGGAGISGAVPDLQESGILMIGAGVVVIIGGIVSLLQGIFSLLASKNSKYGTAAWVFAILAVISAALNLVGQFGAEVKFADLISPICSIVISIILYVAANTVRKAYKAGEDAE